MYFNLCMLKLQLLKVLRYRAVSVSLCCRKSAEIIERYNHGRVIE